MRAKEKIVTGGLILHTLNRIFCDCDGLHVYMQIHFIDFIAMTQGTALHRELSYDMCVCLYICMYIYSHIYTQPYTQAYNRRGAEL